MKSSVEYIKNELSIFFSKFLGVSIKYACEQSSNYHIIEIEPYDALVEKDEFRQWATDFWKRFEREFKEDNLLISESSCLNDMNNLLYEYSGHLLERKDTNNYDFEYSYSFDDYYSIDLAA